MKIRFYIDPESGEPHILSHGVEESEVDEILFLPGEDRLGQEGSRIAIGKTFGGRYLKIIYVPDRDADQAFVITAYELRGKPLTAFRRRMRRRGR